MWRHPAPAAERIESAYIFPPACFETLTRFQHYLLVLRRPRVSDVFKHQLETSDVSNHQLGDVGTTTASSESIVQLIRAGLYLDSADGFGDWRIFLSAKARKYLRKARRDGVIFDIVLKKME